VLPAFTLAHTSWQSDADEELIALLQWLRPAAAARSEDERAVLCPWNLGHAVQYYAGVPGGLTPFGTDVGHEAFRAYAAFVHARTPEEGERVLRSARFGYVLLSESLTPIADALPYAADATEPLISVEGSYWEGGSRFVAGDPYLASIPGWLYDGDGVPLAYDRVTGAPGFRLLYESRGDRKYKLFEVVKGAELRITGARPGEVLKVHIDVQTNQQRNVHWWSHTRADDAGTASFRLPYATGLNGAANGGPYFVRSSSGYIQVHVSNDAIRNGEVAHLDLTR
jgi:hypothetical protein